MIFDGAKIVIVAHFAKLGLQFMHFLTKRMENLLSLRDI